MPWIGSVPNKTTQRGDGTRTGDETWQEAKAAAVKIRAQDHDTHDSDIAQMIDECARKDFGNFNADADINGQKFTDVGNASARTHFAAAGQVQDGSFNFVAAAGTGDAITLDLTPSITAYVTGAVYWFKATATNTGAATVNIDAVGAKDLKKGAAGSTALAAGDITSGGIYAVIYDGTNMQLLNPKTLVGYIVGTDIQAYDELLTEIAALSTDPNADSGLFFDDSAGNVAYWTPSAPLSFSGTNLVVAAATDSAAGVLETATQAEMETGTATDKIVTPGQQHFHPSAAKAWVKWNGTNSTIDASYNMTSITDNGTGDFTLNWATDFASADYAACALAARSGGDQIFVSQKNGSLPAAGTFRVQFYDDAGNARDGSWASAVAFGDHA